MARIISIIFLVGLQNITALEIKKIPKGLYVVIVPKEFSEGFQKYIQFEFMFEKSAGRVFLYDGRTFRSSGGPLTSKTSEDVIDPYDEYLPCTDNPDRLCVNKAYSRSDMQLIPEELLTGSIVRHTWVDTDGESGTGYFVRVNDFYLARKFITAVDALMMYKNKNLSDFGYIRPEIKFAVANQYKPYVTALILREAPGKKGKKLDTLFSGDILTVTEVTKKIETIDKIKAPWVKIKTSTGKEGYVFGGFLEPLGE